MTTIVTILAWGAAAGLVSLLAGLLIGAVIENRDRHG